MYLFSPALARPACSVLTLVIGLMELIKETSAVFLSVFIISWCWILRISFFVSSRWSCVFCILFYFGGVTLIFRYIEQVCRSLINPTCFFVLRFGLLVFCSWFLWCLGLPWYQCNTGQIERFGSISSLSFSFFFWRIYEELGPSPTPWG